MARRSKKDLPDGTVQRVRAVLREYEATHPNATIAVYRYNPVSVRIRIIDPDFQGLDRVDRDTAIWRFLDQLPEEVLAEITLLLLLTPKEAKTSLANLEFENPLPSCL
jgi:hypothetical protein